MFENELKKYIENRPGEDTKIILSQIQFMKEGLKRNLKPKKEKRS